MDKLQGGEGDSRQKEQVVQKHGSQKEYDCILGTANSLGGLKCAVGEESRGFHGGPCLPCSGAWTHPQKRQGANDEM